eukprot:gene16678-22808_t
MIAAVESYRKKCIGRLIRNSTAFGVKELVVIGSPDISTHAAHGAQNYIKITHFYYWKDGIKYIRSLQKKIEVQICGISPFQLQRIELSSDKILYSSEKERLYHQGVLCIKLADKIFDCTKMICFLIGDNKSGLTDEIISYCDEILYIDCPNQRNELLIDYDAKTAICFQKCACSISMNTNKIIDEKFAIGMKTNKKNQYYVSQSNSHTALIHDSLSYKKNEVDYDDEYNNDNYNNINDNVNVDNKNSRNIYDIFAKINDENDTILSDLFPS